MHVGIIMDGNRRYGVKLGVDRKEGHKFGVEALKNLFEKLKEDDLGIRTFTFYTFSKENFSRSKEEKNYLFGILKNIFSEVESKVRGLGLKKKYGFEEKKVNVNVIGDLSLFPEDIKNKLLEVEKDNVKNPFYNVNFLLGYSGQLEIVEGVKNLFFEFKKGNVDFDFVKNLDEDSFRSFLWLGRFDPVNIIVRTGSDDRKRLSGFMLYDSSYAEFYFLDKFWPEFTFEDLKSVIEDYKNKRVKNFGK